MALARCSAGAATPRVATRYYDIYNAGHVRCTQYRMPNTNHMSDFTCQCTDTMVATCTSSFASAYLCAAVVAISVVLVRMCTCDWGDDNDMLADSKKIRKNWPPGQWISCRTKIGPICSLSKSTCVHRRYLMVRRFARVTCTV